LRDTKLFEGIRQAGVQLGEHTFPSPCFYYDAMATMAAFLTPLSTIRAALPSRHLHPVRVTPWHGFTLIYAYQYSDTDIGPYNEVAVAFPVTVNKPAPIGLGALKLRSEPLLFVKELPVNTEIARVAGVECYSYPKFLANIEFERNAGFIHCRMTEGDEHILTLSTRELTTSPTSERPHVHGLSMRGERILRSEIIVDMRRLGVSRKASDVRLDLGNHRMSETIRELRLGRMMEYRYLPSYQSILTPGLETY
jgi:hypothetical protein